MATPRWTADGKERSDMRWTRWAGFVGCLAATPFAAAADGPKGADTGVEIRDLWGGPGEKVRIPKIVVAADASRDDLESAARSDPKVNQLLAGKDVVKTIVVPGRLVNFVVN